MKTFNIICDDIGYEASIKYQEYLKLMCDFADRFVDSMDCDDAKLKCSIEDGELNICIILVNCVNVFMQTDDEMYLNMCKLADKISFASVPDNYDADINNMIVIFSKNISG